jgi:importin subunit alpha-1
VIQTGTVPYFVQFLARDDLPQLQFEAAWALTNIASGNHDETLYVLQLGAVPHFVRLLATPNVDVLEQAIWALGNIAGDSPQCRDLVLTQGVLAPLLLTFDAPTPPRASVLRNATWALSNLCRGKNPAPSFAHIGPALPMLARLLYHPDPEVLTDACWALSYLTDGTNEHIQRVIEAGVCRRLIELLSCVVRAGWGFFCFLFLFFLLT